MKKLTERNKKILDEISAAIQTKQGLKDADCVITSMKIAGEKECFGFHFEPCGAFKRGDIIRLTNKDFMRVEAIV